MYNDRGIHTTLHYCLGPETACSGVTGGMVVTVFSMSVPGRVSDAKRKRRRKKTPNGKER